ncbi:MAG TPA: hypothetical protein VF980_20895 [Thermoanaerobaculia bacterium]
MRIRTIAVAAGVFIAAATALHADCLNKFANRSERPRQVVTLLTGMLTFDSARALADAIRQGKAAPLEWLDASGKTIAREVGFLKIVRPMPVGCDGNSSGVIMIAEFVATKPPANRMIIRLDANRTVVFEEQR